MGLQQGGIWINYMKDAMAGIIWQDPLHPDCSTPPVSCHLQSALGKRSLPEQPPLELAGGSQEEEEEPLPTVAAAAAVPPHSSGIPSATTSSPTEFHVCAWGCPRVCVACPRTVEVLWSRLGSSCHWWASFMKLPVLLQVRAATDPSVEPPLVLPSERPGGTSTADITSPQEDGGGGGSGDLWRPSTGEGSSCTQATGCVLSGLPREDWDQLSASGGAR